jgi:Protein of unknown function (DUF1264)
MARCRFLLTVIPGALLVACGGDNTGSTAGAPGATASAKMWALDGGNALLQEMPPVGALNVYVNGFHFYNGNMTAQMEAHHYCSILNEDLKQCILFDGNGADAKLTGVEYIVSRRLFETLPLEEKRLWHSHVYEVKSGQLIAPGVPDTAEHAFMAEMVGTYGKTWHTWHTDQNFSLPLGHPMLMMGFTADGQAETRMINARDRRFDVGTTQKRRSRKDIAAPRIIAGADAWKQGHVLQLMLHPASSPGIRMAPDLDEIMTMDRGLGRNDTPYFEADRAAAAAEGLHFRPAAQRTGSTCPSPINASFSPAVPQLQ